MKREKDWLRKERQETHWMEMKHTTEQDSGGSKDGQESKDMKDKVEKKSTAISICQEKESMSKSETRPEKYRQRKTDWWVKHTWEEVMGKESNLHDRE